MPSKNLSSYPVEIANSLYKRWCEKGVPRDNLPDCGILESIVDCAYQSSLLREEGEETRCRLLVARRVELDEQRRRFPNCIDYLGFDHPIELSPQNIRKLAHAAGFYRSMLLVDPSLPVEQSLWGIAVTGTDWSIHSGTKYTGRRPLPPNVVIQVRGAGNLVLASGNDRLLECAGGIIMEDVFDPFQSSWLPLKFAAVRVGLLDDARRGLDPAISTELCDTFVKRAAQSAVRRILQIVRNQSHGGMLIYLPDDMAKSSESWIRYRVKLNGSESTLRFRDILVRLLRRSLVVAFQSGIPKVTWEEFLKMRDPELSELHRDLMEFANVLADFMSIDGALVLTRSFHLVGFGGEIMGDSHVHTIQCALDLDAALTRTERADTSGTRHRSAYRLVSSVPEAIVVVVSQDGGVRFVAHHNGQITYWPYLP